MKSSIFAILIFVTTGCAQYQSSIDKEISNLNQEIEKHNSNFVPENYVLNLKQNPKSETYGEKVIIHFETYDQLKEKELKRVQNESLDSREAEKSLSSIPKGGLIHIRIFGLSIDSANTGNFLYILSRNGKEILRSNGTGGIDGIPSTPSQYGAYGRYWTNSDVMILDKPLKGKDEIKLIVANKIVNERDEFSFRLKTLEEKTIEIETIKANACHKSSDCNDGKTCHENICKSQGLWGKIFNP